MLMSGPSGSLVNAALIDWKNNLAAKFSNPSVFTTADRSLSQRYGIVVRDIERCWNAPN